jgi:acetyl-CoA carboxylase carboxyltransferase component
MGGEQAAQVMLAVKQGQLAREGKALNAAEQEAIMAPIREKYEREGHPYYASARLWDDGVVDMRHTRAVLAASLATVLNAPIQKTNLGVLRM